jgi:hypothetical protein
MREVVPSMAEVADVEVHGDVLGESVETWRSARARHSDREGQIAVINRLPSGPGPAPRHGRWRPIEQVTYFNGWRKR